MTQSSKLLGNQLRQIRDIISQAGRISTSKVDFEEVLQFGKYSRELATSLRSSQSDEFLLTLINEIPDLDIEAAKSEAKSKLYSAVTLIVGGIIPFLAKDDRKANEAKPIIKDIQSKYSSIESIMKNLQ